MSLIILILIVLSQSEFSLIAAQCKYLVESEFEKCSNETEWENVRYRHIMKVAYNPHDNATENCTLSKPCRRIFHTARIDRSFDYTMSVAIAKMLSRCCGKCIKFQEKFVNATDAEAVYQSDDFDIVYPVFSSRSIVGAEGFYFIPVYNLPNAYDLTLEKEDKEVAIELIGKVLRNWQLMIICALISLVAGFIIWVLETWSNEACFPRPFLSGVYEGFWWGIVSMTTVGYGDKVPRSFLGRMFAVAWCLIGMLICSISVASVATVILDVTHPPTPKLCGQKVGALQDEIHTLMKIAQQGGIAHGVISKDAVDGVRTLLTHLHEKKIDGALVGRTTYYQYHDSDKQHVNVPVRLTEISFKGDDLVAGMLVKDATDYRFFKRYFEMNWAFVQGCFAFRNSGRRLNLNLPMHNPLQGLFRPFLGGTFLCLGFIGVFGVAYELIRRKKVYQMFMKSLSKVDQDPAAE